MFSNLSSQVTGWMGKKTGAGGNDEIGGQPPEDDTAATMTSGPPPEEVPGDEVATSPDGKKELSPTKGGSRLDMLGNFGGSVKNQMSSWLGGGISGLTGRKTEGGDAAASPPAPISSSPTSQLSNKGSPSQDKDDDASSATGGADSDAALDSAAGTPTDDKDPTQAMGAVSTKAIAGAKSIGNFLYSAVNKAGKTVSEASAKIKKTVEENSLLGEFNKEQEAFIKEKNGKGGGAPVPPWVGCPNQETLKEECLSLSTDRKNFVRAPPEGVEFTFDYESQFPVCQSILAEDPNLEKMRFELVPKVISEENFWRNYLYRVSLICQANEVSSMVQEKSGDGSQERASSLDAQAPASTVSSEVLQGGANSTRHRDDHRDEFVSDSLLSSSAADLAEVREGIKKLGIDASKLTEEDWERELEAELQDYELVGDGSGDKLGDDGADHLSDIDDLK